LADFGEFWGFWANFSQNSRILADFRGFDFSLVVFPYFAFFPGGRVGLMLF
jgi:hypothetical protein